MPRWNLLFIYTDEQAFNTLQAYGNRQIQMPNLNRLADQSMVFDQVYVTQPVCTPSRSSLLTGLYPHTTGCTENSVPLRTDTQCLPEMIVKGDYATAHFGKWHLGDEIFAQHGFHEWVSIEDNYHCGYSDGRDGNAKSSYHHFLTGQGYAPKDGKLFSRDQCARLPEEVGKPAFLAQEASRFIRDHKSRPFVLYVNFLEPHMPFFSPRDDQHDSSCIPLPPNFADVPGADRPLKTRLLRKAYFRHGHSGLPLRTEDDWRRMIAHYWGLCSLVDTHVGTILNTLDECGLDDRTIVVFTSDHGDMMGSHRLLTKCVMFQEAVRVPMLIRLPGQRISKRVTGPVSQIDLVPTLLELLGQPLPDHLQGRSLCQVMESSEPAVSESAFIEWNGPNNGLGDISGKTPIPEWMTATASPENIRAACLDPLRTIIRPDGWKLNYSPLGEHELYNLKEDPHEMRNLFREEKSGYLVRELADHVWRWQDGTEDTVDLPAL